MNKKWTISLIGGIFIMLVGVLVFVGMKGCIDTPLSPKPGAENTYILVEYIRATNTEHIGEGIQSIININPASDYRFDEENKRLEIVKILPEANPHFNKDAPFKLALGVKHSIIGDIMATGGGREIVFIENFPYEFPASQDRDFGDSKPLHIIDVDKNGIVFLKFNDKDLKIKPNAEMEIQGESKVTEVFGIQVRMTDTYIFKNHGFCSKKNITINE